jgi:hypothetical protein
VNSQLYNFLGNVDNLFAHQKNKYNLTKIFNNIFLFLEKKVEKKVLDIKKRVLIVIQEVIKKCQKMPKIKDFAQFSRQLMGGTAIYPGPILFGKSVASYFIFKSLLLLKLLKALVSVNLKLIQFYSTVNLEALMS